MRLHKGMTHGSTSLLRTPGFLPLWASQCLLSFNDHSYKILVSMLTVDLAARTGQAGELPLVAAAFVVPFLLFSGIAGRLADTTSKPALLRFMKVVEVLAMLAGTAAFAMNSLPAMIGVVFLMGTHSTFYGPARAGFTPELVGTRALAGANGLLDMGSYLSIVLGTLAGTVLFGVWKDHLWYAGVLLTTIALIGLAITMRLPKGAPAADSKREKTSVLSGIKHLIADKPLARTVLGIAGFWFLGALMQILILPFAKHNLHLNDSDTGLLLAALAIGIGLGSFLAGRISKDHIELGLLPFGGVGMVIGLAIFAFTTSFIPAAIALLAIGMSAGLWIVPLDAFLQYRAKPEERGRVLGVSSFVNTLGTLAAPGLMWIVERTNIPLHAVLVFAAVVALIGTGFALMMNLRYVLRFVLNTFMRTIYRVEVSGQENIPATGGALIVCNHVTFIDGLLLTLCTPRFVRFLVIEKHYNQFKWLMQYIGAIPVRHGRPRDVVQMIERARKELQDGRVVCIFPEGDLTHTGQVMPFQRGMEKIAEGLDVPVIPVYQWGLWGSIFSYEGGRILFKWPKRIPYPVRVEIGAPLPKGVKAAEAREAVVALSAEAARRDTDKMPQLQQAFVRAAKKYPARLAVADSTGKELSFHKLLTGALLLSKQMRQQKGEMIGIMLPASVGAAVTNVATMFAKKTPVNLNFTVGAAAVDSAMSQCQIQTIVTSKAFCAKAKIDARPEMVYLEDLFANTNGLAKVTAAVTALLPGFVLERMLRQGDGNPHDLATVLFSSGSSGQPKGVMLSHANLLSNIEASAHVIPLTREDKIAGILPFFHSFGFNFTLWFPLVRGVSAVYHANPMDAKGVGTLIEKYRATVLLATPTFSGMYTRTVEREKFASLKLVLVGAEKLRPSVAEAFHDKFGITPMEGYGATEMAPVIAVNTWDVQTELFYRGNKPCTVGRPLPGVAVQTVDPATYEALPAGSEGLILVSGANRMMGYWNDAGRSAEVIRDGWYITGDVGRIDEDGFLHLTGRLSRFSKIAGEMIPHGRIEEAVQEVIAPDKRCCVVALSDEERGERIVVVYDDAEVAPAALAAELLKSGLPNLWIPKKDCLLQVPEVPQLGSGKTDLRRAKELAEELVSLRTLDSAGVPVRERKM